MMLSKGRGYLRSPDIVLEGGYVTSSDIVFISLPVEAEMLDIMKVGIL